MRRLCLAFLAASVALAPGCGYTLRPPYNREIQTVYVPMFKSTRFRRDLNIRFTDLVQEEIRKRTPYTVVGSPEGADATLSGSITLDEKNLVLENPNNLPRQLQTMIFCTVTYVDSRNRAYVTRNTPGNPIPPAMVVEMGLFEPELGETAMLGFDKTLQKMARDVVNMMEEPWGDEFQPDPDIPPMEPLTPEDMADAPKARTPRRL